MNAICVWDFTAFQYDISETRSLLKANCKKWSFQEEMGSLNGTKHLQGRISLKTKQRLQGVVKMFPAGWHWSVTSNENRDNAFYVTKEETRVAGPWADTDEEIYIPRQIRGIELYPWQSQVIKDSETFNSRTVNVIIDTKGNIGKSTLKTYIGANRIGRAIPFVNDFKDIMRIIMDTSKMKLYVIDMPRALRKTELNNFWAGIEELKNGYAWDDRYKFREQYFDSPAVWILTNEIPDTSLLSRDRWRFHRIKKSTMELKRLKKKKLEVP